MARRIYFRVKHLCRRRKKTSLTRRTVNVITRAITERKKLALGGGIGSFKIDFKPSAKGYNNPDDPTTLRPFQRYMEAMTLRSTDTGKATPGRSDMMIPKILARRQRIYGFVSSAKIDFKKMPSKALEGLALALSTQGLFLILMAV